jgi:hypothetical protein
MYWANFLHIYQPIGQAKDILEQVTNQSYRRIFRGLRNIPGAKVTLNISGALSELLVKEGFHDVIDDIRALAEAGNLEFTETAKYHAFLPFLSEGEIERQILLNHETNKQIFGEVYVPKSFFPPEMAYDDKVGIVVSRMGYKTIILDEIVYSGKVDAVPYDRTFPIADTKLRAVFRDRRSSNLIISAVARKAETFLSTLGDEAKKDRYLLTAMDGETFGHHRPGLEEVLFGLAASPLLPQCFISEISAHFPPGQSVRPLPATWASSEYDIEHRIQFHSWHDSENLIHTKQWELFDLAVRAVRESEGEPSYIEARKKLDAALASDQFFWASNRPWWSLEMIEQGAWLLLDTIQSLGKDALLAQKHAHELYNEIISLGFTWQREGKIRKESHELKEQVKIPFKERTLESGKPEVYQAFVELMEREMKKSAAEKNYEQAILWRDGIWKLETKNDMYDAVHAVDLLRYKLPLGEIEAIMDRYKEQYKKIRGGQAEDRR